VLLGSLMWWGVNTKRNELPVILTQLMKVIRFLRESSRLFIGGEGEGTGLALRGLYKSSKA